MKNKLAWLWSFLNVLDFAVSGVLFLTISRRLRLRLSNSGAILRNKAAACAVSELLGDLKQCRILDLGEDLVACLQYYFKIINI